MAHCRITIRRMVGKDNEGSVLFALHLFKFEVYLLLFRLVTGNIAPLSSTSNQSLHVRLGGHIFFQIEGLEIGDVFKLLSA